MMLAVPRGWMFGRNRRGTPAATKQKASIRRPVMGKPGPTRAARTLTLLFVPEIRWAIFGFVTQGDTNVGVAWPPALPRTYSLPAPGNIVNGRVVY